MVPELIKARICTKINLKEILGRDEMEVFVRKGSTVDDLLRHMVDMWGHRLASWLFRPGGDELLPGIRIEINGRDVTVLGQGAADGTSRGEAETCEKPQAAAYPRSP